jgi:autotransporter strand-loop-strand O-heptosyltransferase
MEYKDDIFIIDCWIDTESKENDLISLIKKLREFEIPILLTGHYPVRAEIQKMVDYYLFDKDNPLLLNSEFASHDVASCRWTEMGDWKVETLVDFHHDYAIWTTWKNAFNFAKYLGKSHIHFLEYDNLIDTYQYRQSFLEQSRNYDAILYEYQNNSTFGLDEFCATYIFSIKTEVAISLVNLIIDKHDYFTNKPGGWQLERVFLKCLKEVTGNINVSKYIANDNELNTQAVWNRDGVYRNGEPFQIYLAGDENGILYVHLISGFHEKEMKKDTLVEIVYGDFKKFQPLHKGDYLLVDIGKYKRGGRVKIYSQGVEVFNEFLKDDFDLFRNKNKVTFKPKVMTKCVPSAINVHFIDGPYFNVSDNEKNIYHVEFIDSKTNTSVYSLDLEGNSWARASKKNKIDWLIRVTGNEFNFEHKFNPENQKVYISFESKALGDTIAWIPYVDEFRKQNKCDVVCSTFHNKLFKYLYPNIKFVEPGTIVYNIYAQYRLGYFFEKDDSTKYDKDSHKTDPKIIPLQMVASDILGLDYVEIRPELGFRQIKGIKIETPKKKQVVIAIHSTAQAKYWNNKTGWQDVVDYLRINGYKVVLLSKEEDGYMGNFHPIGIEKYTQSKDDPIGGMIRTIQESELFIGISSGLSWVAWACGTPTILISGFTDEYVEPTIGVTRIINKNVCHGCWGRHTFDAGDWKWCPEHKGTSRHFECTKEISSEEVIFNINNILNITEISSPPTNKKSLI